MPQFVSAGQRLIMRYPERNFNFGNLRGNASAEGIFEFASAIASLQSVQPREIVQVITQELV